MMLVEHDIEPEIVAGLVFVVITMKQIGGDARIAFAIGMNDAQRPGMIVPGRIIGLLAKLIDSHDALPSLRSFNELHDFLSKNFRLLLMRKVAGAFDRF